MANWYQVHECGAGRIRMEFLWLVYRICGVHVLKVLVGIISFFIALGARGARESSRKYRQILNKYQAENHLPIARFSSIAHIGEFARSVVDKMSAICDGKTPIKFEINDDADRKALQNILLRGVGVFFLCSHLGNIEGLCAIPNAPNKKMHAFMDVGQNATFRRFIDRYAKYKNTIIHPTEGIDVAMAGNMYDAIQAGELVMMAADRQSPNSPGRVVKTRCLGMDCALPAGVFRFARVCECPIFAIANMNMGGEKYRVFVKQITAHACEDMATQYMEFLQQLILKYPRQWFNFFDFWAK